MLTCQHAQKWGVAIRVMVDTSSANEPGEQVAPQASLTGVALDPHSELPLYVQVKNVIKEKIRSNDWPVGTAIPPQREFCAVLDVSRITVTRALQELAADGTIVTRQGVGNFVSGLRRPRQLTAVSELYRRTFGDSLDGGESHTHRLIGAEACLGADVPGNDGLFGDDMPMWKVTRLRLVDGKALNYEVAYIRKDAVPEGVSVTELESRLLYDFLTERCGVRLKTTHVEIGADRVWPERAQVLGTNGDDPALIIRRITTDLHGNRIALSINTHPTSSSTYYFEFKH